MKQMMILALSLFALTLPATAQDAPGWFYGTVKDTHGAPIAGAAIRVHDCVATSESDRPHFNPLHDTGASGQDGRYNFGQAETFGPCIVSVSANKYLSYEFPNLRFPEDENTRMDVVMAHPGHGASSGQVTHLPAGSDHQTAVATPVVSTTGQGGPIDTTTINWDLGVFVQGGNGLEDRTAFHFLSAGIYAGRILTNDYTALRANFEYGVELLPLWQSYTPKFQRINCPYGATLPSQCSAPTTTGGTYRGASIVPIILRINMNHGRKLQPWLQGAGGLIYTTRKFPPIGNTNYLDPSQTAPNADTSVWNFDPQFGIGAHYFLKPRRSLDLSANAVHISSASLGDKNPGINTGVQFTLGYSWWK